MLFKSHTYAEIAAGRVTLAFRRWVRPSVRAGGTLKTPVGVLAIREVTPVEERQITESDARAAGYESRQDLIEELARRPTGTLYRIGLAYQGEDPRIALRESADLSAEEWRQLQARLARLDAASAAGPWTTDMLRLIRRNPATRSADLAPHVGQEKLVFKRNVRKLKNLGLTESLGTGYRLSPRGEQVLARLERGK